MYSRHKPSSKQAATSTQVFSYGSGIFGRAIECYRIGEEFFLYGVTENRDPRVLPSLGITRETAASAMP